MTVLRPLPYALLPLLLASACTGSSTPQSTVLTTNAPMPEAAPRELAFVFRARGPDGAIPTSLVFHANLPIFPSAVVGKAPPAGTELVLEPAAAGSLTVEDRDSVVFTPTDSLKPATTYTLRLKAIGGEKPPEWLQKWTERTATFTTPPFGFTHATLAKWDKKSAVIQLEFSGPVSVDDVAKHVKLTAGERTLDAVYNGGGSPNIVTAEVRGPEFASVVGNEVAIALSGGIGLTSDPTVTAPAASSTVLVVAPGPKLAVLGVKVREGMNGFYVDVVCDDGAVTDKRWYWDHDSYDDYDLSTRCMLTDESAQHSVHLSIDGKDEPITVSASSTGFRVFGDLPYGQATLRVDTGARTVDGATLQTSVEQALDVPHRAARIDFASQGRYLPHSAWTSLAIQHTNVPAVELTVRHIPEENVVFWLSGAEPADERTSDVVLKKKVALAAPIDERVTSYVDVGSLLPDAESGVYEIGLATTDPAPEAPDAVPTPDETDTGGEGNSSESSGTAAAVSRILLTDMHLIAKVAATDPTHSWARAVDVWTIDVHTNKAVPDSAITLVRPSGQIVARGTTDSDGHCQLAIPADGVDTTAPIALLARNKKDFTYLKFADLRLQLPEDTAGATGVEAPYQAAIWTDRGVYRPGDTAHTAVLIRGDDHLAPQPAVPMALKLYDPTGKELRKQVVEPNEAGLATWDVAFGDWATTGPYRVSAEIGAKVVGSASFNVEEFVPERLKVMASAAVANALATDSVPVDVEGDWLFGGAATGSKVELTCQIEPGTFAPKGSGDYRFGPVVVDGEPTPRPITLGVADGALDALGKAHLTCPTSPSAGGLTGPGTLVARAAVFEGDSGRTTVQEVRLPVHPDRAYVGLKAPDQAESGHPFKVEGVVVDWEGKAVSGNTTVQLTLSRVEEEMGWTWDDATNESVYRRTPRRAREAGVAVVAVNGVFSTDLAPAGDAAGWVVTADLGHERTEVRVDSASRRWWWSSWDSSVDQTPRPQLPDSLALTVPDSAKVGDSVTVHTLAPYAGHVLWTVEADSVIQSHWEEVKAGPASWSFPVEAFRPNVYVSALIVKDPHLESPTAFIPDRAFGVANLRILPEQYAMPVKLVVPDEVRPQSPLTVSVDIGAQTEPAFVTIAAVDEGILSLTKFPDPDPATAIFARRALGVESYETVGWTLLSQPGGASRGTGGDAGGAGFGRVQMVHPVALWSGVVAVPSSGKATVTLQVPSYRGSLHIMAVAATRSRMGHASQSTVVRDPLTLVATMPRFLTVGDVAQVPVQITNLTGGPQTVNVEMKVSEAGSPAQLAWVDLGGGGLAIASGGAQTGTLTLAPNASGTLVFQLAAKGVGAARVDIRATAGKELSTDHFDIPVELSEPEVTETVRVPLADAPVSLAGVLTGWKPGSEHTQIWVTANPYAQAFSHLKYLLHYPYGCIEQTTSSARPLLYAQDLVTKVAPDSIREHKIADMVQAGIDRVLSMQTPSGGFSYWPGERDPVVWGTTYAVHFLLDAQQAGYAVPKDDVDDAVRWLGRQLDSTRITDHDRAYAHYLLARAGQPQLAAAQRLYDNLGHDARDEDRYTLQAAIWLAGDHRYEKELKHPAVSMAWKRENDWTFWSELRERGLILSIFRDLFGDDPAGQPLADVVAGELSGTKESWAFTTQELAWGLTGLGKSVGKAPESVTATLFAGGITQPPLGAAGSATWLLSRPTMARGALTVAGKPGLYAVVTTSGNRVAGEKLWGGQGLAVSRVWKTAAGDVVNPATLKLGDPIYVDITVENKTGYGIQNIALTDRIPAAWEIENPRLGRGAMPDWADPDTLWTTDNMNVRDDRVEVFGTLAAGQSAHVVYMVRATFAGSFHLPDVSTEAMYDPELWARTAGGPVVVTAPWEGQVR